MMKNAFYFILKVLFVLKIFEFLSWFFGYVGKRFDKKAKFNFKFYDFTDWTANKHKHILSNIFRIVCNQAIKFGQLLEYNTRSTFLEKSAMEMWKS